jgi:hypothetical protein
MGWSEVTNVIEIRRLSKLLRQQIKASTVPGGFRAVGYPGDNQPFKIRLGEGEPGTASWAFCGEGRDGKLLTLVGQTPEDANWQLMIDLQCNFRADKFTRSTGGAFLRDDDGNVLLAHRGILTRGQRLKTEEVVQRLPQTWWVHAKGPRGKSRSFIAIARLDSPSLFEELCAKAKKLRQYLAVDIDPELKAGREAGKAGGQKGASGKGATKPASLEIVLKGYKRDFESTWTIPAKLPSTATRGHGRIVNALQDQLRGLGGFHTTVGIDLAVTIDTPKRVHHVFEVKTSSDTQSIYTAIGQLVFNGAVLRKSEKRSKIIRYLVLPGDHKASLRQQLCRDLGFQVITYKLGVGKNVEFSGLKLA